MAGRTAKILKFTGPGALGLPFCVTTDIWKVPAWVNCPAGIVARTKVVLMNVVGTGMPAISATLVLKRFAPFTKTSCCTDPCAATVGSMFVTTGGPPGPIATAAVAIFEGSAVEVAVIVTPPDGAVPGAWYNPLALIDPNCDIGAGTLQLTALLGNPDTVAVN